MDFSKKLQAIPPHRVIIGVSDDLDFTYGNRGATPPTPPTPPTPSTPVPTNVNFDDDEDELFVELIDNYTQKSNKS